MTDKQKIQKFLEDYSDLGNFSQKLRELSDKELLEIINRQEVVQRERLNEETIEEQDQVKCDYCGRDIDDCDCV